MLTILLPGLTIKKQKKDDKKEQYQFIVGAQIMRYVLQTVQRI